MAVQPKDAPRPLFPRYNNYPVPPLMHDKRGAAFRLYGDPRRTQSIDDLVAKGLLKPVKFNGPSSTSYFPDSQLVALVEKGLGK